MTAKSPVSRDRELVQNDGNSEFPCHAADGERAGAAGALSVTERKRRQRERQRQEESQLFFESADWTDFLDLGTLPRKAGCYPADLPVVVANELMANACDVATTISTKIFTDQEGLGLMIKDDGPGIDPALVPDIFSPNRHQLSTKHQRRCTSGALGNGARVAGGTVAATGGTLVVETRGHRLALALDPSTGKMRVTADQACPPSRGLTLWVALGPALPFEREHFFLAMKTLRLLGAGEKYSGPSSPHWYGPSDLYRLCREVMPASISFVTLCHRLGFKAASPDPAWKQPARGLTLEQVTGALIVLRSQAKPIPPKRLGHLGRAAFGEMIGYACEYGVVTIRDAELPCVAEVWARCEKAQSKGEGNLTIELVVNRAFTTARLRGNSTPSGLTIHGCDLHHRLAGPRTGDYQVVISVITPYLDVVNDGEDPSLNPYLKPIFAALVKACSKAHRAIAHPESIEIKEAAWEVMEQAYLDASDGGTLPAQSRQIMYSARPHILARTGLSAFKDQYFTQVLLPDYVKTHPDETAQWDVVWDARGNATEPHTNRRIPLGTLSVRQYLSEVRHGAQLPQVIDLPPFDLYPTVGPFNRYQYALFVEKEGFGPLLAAGAIAEKYDLLIASTKGMSVTALRILFDELHEHGIRKVFVLHDFDISGFTILGTLGTSSRRYRFANQIEVVDLGLRLEDVQTEELQTEPIPLEKDPNKQEAKWEAQARTLERHGATPAEIEFLQTERSELNMLTGRRFLSFIERKLAAHGVAKYVPKDDATLRLHLQRFREWQLARKLLNQHRSALSAAAAAMPIPPGLRRAVAKLLKEHPQWPWDRAVSALSTPPPPSKRKKKAART